MPAWSSRSTPTRYNKNLSVAENLLFGTPVGKDFDGDNLAADPYVQSVLTQTGLDHDLLRMGLSIAETMVELFSGLSPDNPLFEQYSFISADELPNVRLLLQRLGGKGIEAVPEADRARLMTLPLRYIEARHRLGLIDARHGRPPAGGAARLRAPTCPPRCAARSNSTISGATTAPPPCRTTSCSDAWSTARRRPIIRIGTLISEVLDELGLRDSVIEVGLDYNVGVAGKRLPATQRQKLGIARALIKRPQFLVVNEAVAVFDGRTQDASATISWRRPTAAASSGSPTGRARPSRSSRSSSCRAAGSPRRARQGRAGSPRRALCRTDGFGVSYLEEELR